jgi:hypothetical protein
MIHENSTEVQARQALSELVDAKEIVGWFRQFHLCKTDAVLLATFQSVIGFSLIAVLDMPLSLVGYGFVAASALLFSRMKAVLDEFDRSEGGARD